MFLCILIHLAENVINIIYIIRTNVGCIYFNRIIKYFKQINEK